MAADGLKHPPARPMVILGLVLLLLIGWLDYLTGPDFSFSIFYLPSIAMIAWYGGKWAGIMAAGGGASLWFFADYYGAPPLTPEMHAWRAFVRLCMFVITALFVRSIRLQILGLEHNAARKAGSRDGFHRMLPVCSYCRRVRDEQMNWHMFESFLKEQTDLEFTQIVCPDCAEDHYRPTSSHHTGRITKRAAEG